MSTVTSTVTSAAQRQQYEDQGYTVVRNLIPLDHVRTIREILARVEAGEVDWEDRHFHIMRDVKDPKGGPLRAGVQLPSVPSPEFKAVADHARLQGAMAELLGGEVVRSTDQAGIKSRYITTPQGGQSFYHQDSYYWKIQPQLGCNAWIALDEVGPGAIALGIMPGTHKDWKIEPHEAYYDDPPFTGHRSTEPFKRYRIPRSRIDFSKEVVLDMQPGDAAFFTNFTWHRAEPNKTGVTRCFYAVAYKRNVASDAMQVPAPLDVEK